MKKHYNLHSIRCNSLLFAVIFCMASCSNQENKYTNFFYKMESTSEEPIIDFSTIDCLNESNQKAIELSSKSLRLTTDLKTLELLLKIKRDHKKINSDFKRLTNDNLIIIPKPIYNIDVSNDSIHLQKPEFAILKKLQTEIKNQITSFDIIEKKTKNNDFKLFAIQSKRILNDNNEALKTLLSS